MFIYKITNKLNGKIYVGQTIRSVERRFYFHCKNKKSRSKLTNAIQKCGKENFSIEILEQCFSIEELDKKEIKWIKELNSIDLGYNIQTGGYIRDSMRGKKHSEETKNKMRIAATGRKLDEQTLTKLKKPKTKEHCLKNGLVHSKSVVCITTGQTFPSGKAASEYFNVNAANLSKVLKGKAKTCKGLVFVYAEDKDG